MIDGLNAYREWRKVVPDLDAFDDARTTQIMLRFLTQGIAAEHRHRAQLASHPDILAEWVADIASDFEEAQTAITELTDWLAKKGLTP